MRVCVCVYYQFQIGRVGGEVPGVDRERQTDRWTHWLLSVHTPNGDQTLSHACVLASIEHNLSGVQDDAPAT